MNRPASTADIRAQAEATRRLAWPDAWARSLNLKVDGHPFNLDDRKYVQQVIRDPSERIVIKKAAQTGFTVLFLIRSFHWIVQRKWHIMYLLPLKAGIIPFVQARVDTIMDSNPQLQAHFKSVDNRLHKQTLDDIKFLFRGTNIENELQETPVDCEVWDERDRMVETFLADARRRMDGSKIKRLTELSTPTVPGFGIDSDDLWGASDQHEWEVPCPHCGRFQVLYPSGGNLEDHVVLGDDEFDCELRCIHCKKSLSDEQRFQAALEGRWEPQNLGGTKRGYHISQFASPTVKLAELMEDWYLGQEDAKHLKTFFNHGLGETYSALGDRITPELLDNCIVPGQRLGGIPGGPVYVGIDIGDVIHVTACYLKGKRLVLWQLRIFHEWDEVDKFLSDLSSFICVIDGDPERRAARDLSLKYHGRVWIGFAYDRPQTVAVADWSKKVYNEACKVTIDKPMAMDTVIQKFIMGNVVLPHDARELGENMPEKSYNGFYHQMTQLVRVEMEDTRGIIVARWQKNKNKDHWHHSFMFMLMATFQRPPLHIPASIAETISKESVVA